MSARAIERVRSAVHRHGFWGLVRWSAARAYGRVHLVEEHHWYALDPGAPRPTLSLPAKLRLVRRAADAPVPWIDNVPILTSAGHQARTAQGGEVWTVQHDEATAFACWIFPRSTPMLAAAGGWFALPGGVICLEDSITSPDFRGQGIAPTAWSLIASKIGASDVRWIVTKVETENLASRRAVEKAGFEDIGTMRTNRIGWKMRVSFQDARGVGIEVAEILGRS